MQDKESTRHFFRQFGLGCTYVEEDLKMLTLHRVEEGEGPKDALLFFKTTFPVLFEALEAKFELMSSSIRIVEQKHGQMRCSHLLGAGQGFTDAQQSYVTNLTNQGHRFCTSNTAS